MMRDKNKPPTDWARVRSLQEDYERQGLERGLTVSEWEALHAFPPFTVYPGARRAWQPAHPGFFMYDRGFVEENGSEEDRQMKCLIAMGISYRETGKLFGLTMSRVWKRLNL
jgi:hypothetical protein